MSTAQLDMTDRHRSRGKPRSTEQHRRFFALIKAAFQHWPERCNFQPDNEEHLRAYLLVRAKHRTIKTFHLPADASDSAALIPVVIATMLGKHAWAWSKGTDLFVCVPESIAFDKIGHAAFCALNDDVDAVIRAETGLDPDKLLKEAEAAA